jgi:hypothetical protein
MTAVNDNVELLMAPFACGPAALNKRPTFG